MIYHLSVGLQAHLKSRRWPVPVIYGPEIKTRTPNETLVILSRNGSSDTFASARGAGPNAGVGQNRGRYTGRRLVGGSALVLARSNNPNARLIDHEALCDDLVDSLLCGAYQWATANRTLVAFSSGQMIPKEQYPGVFNQFPGVLYELTFSVERPYIDSDAAASVKVTGNPETYGYPTTELEGVQTEHDDSLINAGVIPEPEPEEDP